MIKAKYSGRDSEERLYVDCSECVKGGNGDAKDKCSAGWKIKKGDKSACFKGILIAGLEVKN